MLSGFLAEKLTLAVNANVIAAKRVKPDTTGPRIRNPSISGPYQIGS